jgi:hypothetical protein
MQKPGLTGPSSYFWIAPPAPALCRFCSRSRRLGCCAGPLRAARAGLDRRPTNPTGVTALGDAILADPALLHDEALAEAVEG